MGVWGFGSSAVFGFWGFGRLGGSRNQVKVFGCWASGCWDFGCKDRVLLHHYERAHTTLTCQKCRAQA